MQFNKSNKTFLSNEATIQDAVKRYYKSDRLNRAGDSLVGRVERMTNAIEQSIARQGWDILASRHDSASGKAIYITPSESGAGFSIYEDRS